MKIIFMGTPDFAVPSLEKIFNSKHELLSIVTAPDKERGRGQKVSFTPVKEFALQKNLPLFQPEKLKDINFIKALKELAPDLFVVVAFRILPREVFSIPRLGSFNLHASLLPNYRGAAPIQWSIIRGDKETGVTTFVLEDKVDTGNILLQKKIEILDVENFGVVHDKLSLLGADTVIETIDLISAGNFILHKQDDSYSSPAPKINKEHCLIDWNKPAFEVNNLVRGLSPYPGAYFFFKDKLIKIYSSSVNQERVLKTGEIFADKNDLIIGCGQYSLNVFELQLEGRKRLSVSEFLRGFNFSLY
jgi:methionyl-tRNA formyltransferase